MFLKNESGPKLSIYYTAHGIGPSCTKSHDSLSTWLYVVSWQIKNAISPIRQVLWTSNLTGLGLKTKIQKITPLLVKSLFHSWILFPTSEMYLILNRTTIRLLLLVREKSPPIWKFMNLYVTSREIHGRIWLLNFVSLLSSCKLSYKLDCNLFEKNLSLKLFPFL